MWVQMVQNLHHSLYFPGVHWIHSRLLAMGVDSANFALFAGTVGKMHEIWVIHSNLMEFSADVQKSESMEVMWMNFVVNFAYFMGIVGKMCAICMIHCNLDRKSDLKKKICVRNFKDGEPNCVRLSHVLF